MKPLDPRLLKRARDARRYIILLVIFGTVSAALVIAQCYLISASASPVIDGDKTFSQVSYLVAILAAVFLARVAITYIIEAYGHRAALRTIRDLRTQVLDHSGEVGERWLAQGNTASTVTLVTEALDDLEPYFVKYLPQLFLVCTVTPLTLILIFFTDWLSAVAIIICLPLIPIFMILIGKQTADYSNKRLASMQNLGQQLLDLLSGLSTLKALGREKGPARRVALLGNDFAAKTMATLRVAFLSGAVLEFLATLSTALVAVEVGIRMAEGHLGLFKGLLIIMLTPEAFKPLREVGSQFHASADGITAANMVFETLDVPIPASSGTQNAPDLSASAIVISDLSVNAPGRNTVAPAHLSATIKPNDVAVLRGPSGSGKTTTVSVLLRLIDKSSGEITIGDVSIEDIERHSLWEQVTWVPQRPAIVPGTVLENMGVDISPELEEAARLTGFDSVIAELEDGWNTHIGQGGAGLSIGQRQRLALTRAMVRPQPLVILDEPAAHLDAMNEQAVSRGVEALKKAGHTVIVIAHRNAIMSLADTIIDVEASTIDSAIDTDTQTKELAEVGSASDVDATEGRSE
ncbi:MAG: thiol reductant ABC exporter subunit CydD [Actinomycetaceae bacterium]|nr:thiol reductant ABC exporter subunit CydD [Actinomycetaceae bacterium]